MRSVDTVEDETMATRRDVKQNAAGGWDVLRAGDRRAAVSADTRKQALARAREQVRREGGGEVRLVNDAGKIVRSGRVGAAVRNGSRGGGGASARRAAGRRKAG